MLQRAASNAYSWWWASHIRTKQSKWLEQSLQDMEEKVQYMLKLIEEDGDSFAKRAEMYYKKRPELIAFVEESYRAYRALAERYDHISTELQNANTTIASVFPEQVQFAMDDEEEYNAYRMQKNFPQMPAPNAPKVPKGPTKDLKGIITTASKKFQAKKTPKPQESKGAHAGPKSGLTKTEALEEIDKLQKDILASQTVKEFVKSSYEKQLENYYGIENQINEMQQKVSSLQDEFSVSSVIEDDEARTLMAEAALKSCEDSLVQLEEKQEKSNKDAKEENKRIEDVSERLKSLKNKLKCSQCDEEKEKLEEKKESLTSLENELKPDQSEDDKEKPDEKKENPKQEEGQGGAGKDRVELEALREKIKEQIEAGSKGSLTVTELAEKIDHLVNKVINLESAVSSQTALIDSLRMETDDLQCHIRSLEDDKASLIDNTQNLSKRLKDLEEKLQGVKDLNKNVEDRNTNLQTHFTEARCSLDHLSEKLQNVKPDEELEKGLIVKEKPEQEPKKGKVKEEVKQKEKEIEKEKGKEEKDIKNPSSSKTKEGEEEKKEVKVSNASATPVNNQGGEDKEVVDKCEVSNIEDNKAVKQNSSKLGRSPQVDEAKIGTEQEKEKEREKDEDLNWQQMLLSGEEDREKILLKEYTTILRNYKDVKKRLSDAEKGTQDRLFEKMVEVRELKTYIAKKDQENHALRQRLNQLLAKLGESPDIPDGSKLEASASKMNEDQNILPEEDDEEDIKLIMVDQPQEMSPTEEKLRMNIDAILDENLDFWLRFSTSFHQVQKFRNEVKDLQEEIKELKEKEAKKQSEKTNNSMFTTSDLKSNVRAIYNHMSEKQTELGVWIEQSGLLKDELQRRFSSLCNLQDEITMALKEGVEEDTIKFSSHQAAKFQGEVLNMKQENNKVREELQAGLDHATALLLEVEKTLAKLDEEFGLTEKNINKPQLTHSTSRGRVPLRSFLFGVKQKKKKSIFDCMHQIRKQTDQLASLTL
ncbi:hypothetical protein LguiA_005373 [Lonicera macranthoides]